MTTLRMTLTSNVIAMRGPDLRPFFFAVAVTSFTATLVTSIYILRRSFAPLKYLASFRTTLKVSRYLFRALALLIWLLIAFVSVFYIVNALHQRESEIRQEFNLSSDQAQRFIQRTSDVMKELKYIAENRLTAENGVMSSRARDDKMVVPDF
ncbi:sensor protein RcsC [Salmonella bongori]|nr:sensor protein RcsC [Salmonella bongori]